MPPTLLLRRRSTGHLYAWRHPYLTRIDPWPGPVDYW